MIQFKLVCGIDEVQQVIDIYENLGSKINGCGRKMRNGREENVTNYVGLHLRMVMVVNIGSKLI